MKNSDLQSTFIIPIWPAPANVKALQTTRNGGISATPYNNLNLGSHVADNPIHVAQNRQILSKFLPSEPVWLNQTHSISVVDAANSSCLPDADASYSNRKNVVCVTMTADCLPILLCDTAGTLVTSIHAGWRGLCDGIIEATLFQLQTNSTNLNHANLQASDIMAWLGPAIGPNKFEVGGEVRAQFMEKDAHAESAFVAHGDKYLCDLYKIAKQRLNNLGITQIYGGDLCTFSDKARFFSFRRDGNTGRMGSFIWLE